MRRNTKKFLIEGLLNSGKTRREAFEILRPMVENQQPPMVFTHNVGGGRIPMASISDQIRELGYSINRIAVKLNAYTDTTDFDYGNMPDVDSDAADMPDVDAAPIDDDADDDDDVEPDVKRPVKSIVATLENTKRGFLNDVRRLRDFCNQRAVSNEQVDEIGVRPLAAGNRLLDQGIPASALLAAMTLHWPDHVRADAGVPDFDFLGLSREIMADREIENVTRADGRTEQAHGMFGYALTLVENNQPVLAIGPAGTGKSHLAGQVADYLNLEYSEAPMTPGATRGDLLGRHTISGFVPASFCERYSGGGLFNFEEIDAADPGMLIVLNNALESGTLFNTVSGETHTRHAWSRWWATANTFGLGANRHYTGREKLDAATLDRWRMGRILLAVDSAVEEAVLGL